MISEIFGLLANADVTNTPKVGKKFDINLNKNRIRSISAFSSNAIFYFPVVCSDQCALEEVTMISRALEKQYASFVVACIGLMPFHRIRADDRGSIEEYLEQFHQNLGMTPNSNKIANRLLGYVDSLDENATPSYKKLCEDAGDFYYRIWKESKQKNLDFVKNLTENYVSLNDMYNESALDPYTELLRERYFAVNEELNTWGFLGEATVDMYDVEDLCVDASGNFILDDEDAEDMDDYPYDDVSESEEYDEYIDEATGKVKKKGHNEILKQLMSATNENKIMSCNKLTVLRKIENQLKSYKKKYTKLLNRYKKKYNENKKKNRKEKLIIQFNKQQISDPKAFMKEYGDTIKVINQRLKLCDKRRKQLQLRMVQVKKTTNDKNGETTTVSVTKVKMRGKVNETVDVINELSELDVRTMEYLEDMLTEAVNAPDDKLFLLEEWDGEYFSFHGEPNGPYEKAAEYFKERRDIAEKKIKNLEKQLGAKEAENTKLKKEIEGRKKTDKERKQESAKKDRKINVLSSRNARNEKEKKELEQQLKGLKNGNTSGTDTRDISGGSDDTVYDIHYERNFANAGREGRLHGHKNDLNMARVAGSQHAEFKTFDREVFTKMDMEKCNDMVPTFTKVSIGFIVDNTEDVVSRDVLVGIKTYIHRAPTAELVSDIYNTIINNRKFLKFIKFVTGEEKSLSDLLFGIRELKLDAHGSMKSGSEWKSAFRRRKRLAKMALPYVTKEYTPNGTIVMTMNEVEYIRDTYGLDIMMNDHVKMIMDQNFLLGFVILDQANELVHVLYDGHGYQFQQFTYSMLEREQKTTDRMMRELYRSFSK